MFTNKLEEDAEVRFQCICCGSCCRSGLDIHLNPVDVWTIRNSMKKSTIHLNRIFFNFETRVEYGAYPFCTIKMKENGYCPFMDESLCSIHHFRPAACRFFPVVQYFDGKRESCFAISPDVEGCPGLKADKKYVLQGWLIVNSYLRYEEVIDMTPEIAKVMTRPFDKAISSTLYDIMFNFDKLDDFPFKDEFPLEGTSDDKFIKWLRKKVKSFLKSLDGM